MKIITLEKEELSINISEELYRLSNFLKSIEEEGEEESIINLPFNREVLEYIIDKKLPQEKYHKEFISALNFLDIKDPIFKELLLKYYNIEKLNEEINDHTEL